MFFVCFTFLSNLQWGQAARLYLSERLQLNRQTVAIPAWDVVDPASPQHFKAVSNILQDLEVTMTVTSVVILTVCKRGKSLN